MAKKNNNNSDWMSRKQDEQTEQLEERLTALYANAENEIRAKWDDFMSGFEKEDTARRKLVESGSMPEDEYTAWRKTQILKSNQYSKAVESMSNMLVETDVAAMATVNEELPQVVAESYDFVQGLGFQAAEEAGLTSGTFQIYNARTVQALIKDNPDLMPKPSVDIPEDLRWSKDRINREITQGIVQGESIPKIANRLRQVTTMDRNAAVRNARTAMTGAENLGRYQSAQDLRENGIPIEEVWMATPDDRTRESHRLLDGTTRDESGYFGVGIIDTPLRFAGDPLGAPEEVYNCRCRTGIVLQGIDHSQDGDLYAEFMRQFEDGKEMIGEKEPEPEAQSQHPEPEQKTAEEIAKEENTVVALHITSEDNIEQILNNGFDLERAGTGAGSTWGDGAYFSTGTDEKTFYQYRIGNENGVAAKIDTSDMLTVDFGTGSVKSPSNMYDMAAKQLTEDEYKEYKQHIKEQEATGSEAKRLAFEETVKDHYTGLIIQQDNSEGIDILTGGNQIVVYDTRAIEVLDKANVHDDLEQIATSRIEDLPAAKDLLPAEDLSSGETGIVQGEDMTETWERRENEFEFEIDDIIDAQGFNGLPQVVGEKEFNKAVEESGFIAQRTYSAETKEEIDKYREELYNGDWYVNCQTGGAQYGQGMYCAADYTGTLSDGIKEEMEHYQSLGDARYGRRYTDEETIEMAIGNLPENLKDNEYATRYINAEINFKFAEMAECEKHLSQQEYGAVTKAIHDVPLNKPAETYIETLTLTPDAKIITYDDLKAENEKAQEEAYQKAVEKALGENATEIDKAMFNYTNAIDTKEDRKIIDEFKDKDRDAYQEKMEENRENWKEINREARAAAKEIDNMDLGTFAAMKGYDAINAEGHGESGSYTVILNRTKCIFKRDET